MTCLSERGKKRGVRECACHTPWCGKLLKTNVSKNIPKCLKMYPSIYQTCSVRYMDTYSVHHTCCTRTHYKPYTLYTHSIKHTRRTRYWSRRCQVLLSFFEEEANIDQDPAAQARSCIQTWMLCHKTKLIYSIRFLCIIVHSVFVKGCECLFFIVRTYVSHN